LTAVSCSQIEAPAERLRVVEFLGRIFAHAEDTWHKYRSLFIALIERARKVPSALHRALTLRCAAVRYNALT
jgi:hypothetical protein